MASFGITSQNLRRIDFPEYTLYYDNVLMESGTISYSNIKTNNLVYLTPGTHTLKLILDPENKIQETNENNNEQTITFTTEDCSDIKSQIQPRFQIRTAPNNMGQPGTWTAWLGPDCTSNTYYTSSGQEICSQHNGHNFIQYKVILDDTSQITPAINDVKVTYTGKFNTQPIVALKVEPQEVFMESGLFGKRQEVSFTANAVDRDGEIISYEWDFGDGTTDSTTSNTNTRRYDSPGTYTVTVEVMDEDGAKAIAKTEVYVSSYNCIEGDNPIRTTGESRIYRIKDLPEDVKTNLIIDILTNYANEKGIEIIEIDATVEYYEAVAYFLRDYMAYHLPDPENDPRNCPGYNVNDFYGTAPQYSAKLFIESGLDETCQRCNNFLCGACAEYSLMYTALTRLLGIDEKCVYSGFAPGHGYKIINYNGRFRIYEPQGGSLTQMFRSGVTNWICCGPNAPNIKTCTIDWPCYAPYHVLNDAYGSWDGMSNPSNSYQLTLNYIDNSGLPDTNNNCPPPGYAPLNPNAAGDPNTYKDKGWYGEEAGWNDWALGGSLTYYEDVCP